MVEYTMSPQQGWVCPLCGKVNAPWSPSCDCHLVKRKISSPTYDENVSMTEVPEFSTNNSGCIICD